MAKWRIKAPGFLEIEVLLSAAFLAIIAGSFYGALIYSQQSLVMSGARERAVDLADEGIEAVRAVRDGAMNALVYSQSGVTDTSGSWGLLGEGTDETLGDYTRTITFTEVCRNASDVIVACPGDYTDPGSVQVDVSVAWTTILGVPQTVLQTALFTDWTAARFFQTDWSGGSGQAVWSDETQYESDNGALVINPAGQITLAQNAGACGPVSFTYDTPSEYTYDTGLIEVTGGQAQLLTSSTVSGFQTPVIDTLEFDPITGMDTFVYPIHGDVYAVVYRGSGSDGFLSTFTVDSAGAIGGAVIDTLEFDTSSGFDPVMTHVAGTTYAIAYEGSGSDGFLVTVDIADDGTIGSVIDSEEFDTSNGEMPSIVNVSGSVFAIAYEGSGSDGFLVTYTISAGGTISSQVDSLEFDPSGGTAPKILAVDSDTVAIAYQGPGNDGWLATVDIDGSGNIGSVIDTLEFDALTGLNPSMVQVASGMYAIAYEGSLAPGSLVTVGIADNGSIDAAVTDSYGFESIDADQPFIVSLGSDLFAIAYEGLSGDGFIDLFEIDSLGTITTPATDSFEFQTDNGEDIGMLYTGDVILVSYDGPSTDGFVSTIGLASSGGYATSVPNIAPTTAATVTAIDQWTGFAEVATKNGGEVYYQLSNDGGVTWYYWNGALWTPAAVTQYSTASDVNENIFAFPVGGGTLMVRAFLESDGTQLVQLDQVDLTCATFQTEVGQVTVDDTWTEVSLANTYTSAVVVGSRYDASNTSPTSVRVRNVDEDSFEIRLEHPGGDPVSADRLTYWVVEEGVWTHNAVRIEAARYDTSTVGSQAGGWSGDSIGLRHSFASPPVVFHQVMTDNDTSWISTFVSQDGTITQPPTASGFWLGLMGAEVTTTHGAETIGYIAVDETSAGVIGSAVANYENEITPDTIAGVDNGCYIRTFTGLYAAPPVALVAQQEMDGNNGGWALQCSESTAQIGLQIDEDQENDSERAHTTETVGWIAFDEAFSYSSGGSAGTGAGGGGSYQSPAELVSSAYDMGVDAAVESVEWDEDMTACPSACDIQVQVRTAPDNAGAPGTWTDWYGESGSGTYFTEPLGTRISTDLNENQWLQYRVEITSDGSATPTLEELRIRFRL